ncbi:spondin domain-containing protein [Colwellia echini]|uniref:Spondin domain-containing protein n=1 Tax=Colwellia echini TaxID=1982103 RepID=A0ABY3MVY9_9GAMM|nr:spondin domain-containing protein [Colwellia echini]TYK65375.1 hypothetical protein CWS31_010955 [Colwellia echini]
MSTLITQKHKRFPIKLFFVSLLSLGLFACGDNDDTPAIPDVEEPMEYSYSVMITNLTYAQPLSPIALSLHNDTKMWMIGESASIALEKLAEGGDNTDFLSSENNIVSTSSESPLPPGASVMLDIMTIDPVATYLTVSTMLVNTNDAFSGLTGVDISTLTIGQEKSWNLSVYDAGTEKNTEAAGTIPGPADGGVGFDASRDDTNLVSYHTGIVSKDDGLSNSVLTQAHRFDNPAVKVTITRTK